MTVKEFASKFGMSVTELAEYTGYSRKALYNIIEKDEVVNVRRFNSMVSRLKIDAWRKMIEGKRKIQEDYDSKVAMLDDLEKRKCGYRSYERVV